MIVQIIDAWDHIAYMSELHPSDVQHGLQVEDVIGKSIWKWVDEGAAQYWEAFGRCRKTGVRQYSSISVKVEGQIHRWRIRIDRFMDKGYLVILAINIPANIHQLSERESEVLRLLAQYLTSSQIATKLGITVSTVEKHRSKIRNTLGLKNEHSLLRLADVWESPAELFFDSVSGEPS